MEKPLIILDTAGRVLELGRQNTKGHQKSMEQRTLWYIHPDSGRVLPWDEAAGLETVREKENWYEAVVKTAEQPGSEAARKNTSSSSENKALTDIDVLDSLAGLLKERNKNRPEGSYTTHLFESGAEKIRKKTGEEAIELILAADRDEIVYEAADLIYHTMVLFEALDIPFNDIFSELKKRHQS